jgi:hypothetical protein
MDHCAPALEALLGEHIVQSFLQKDDDARAASKEIVRPRKRKFKEPTHMNCFNKIELADSALPQNIKDFDSLRLRFVFYNLDYYRKNITWVGYGVMLQLANL